jgi:hypothetical protein
MTTAEGNQAKKPNTKERVDRGRTVLGTNISFVLDFIYTSTIQVKLVITW